MKTLNRPTAPSTLAEADLAALCAAAGLLACLEPDAYGWEREQLIAALHKVDLDLERLTVREAVGELDRTDDAELDRCRNELIRVTDLWFGAAPNAYEGAA